MATFASACNDTVPLLEPASGNNNFITKRWRSICSGKLMIMMSHACVATFSMCNAVRSVVMKDTTKTIHALKMGLALVLAFLLVLVHPSYAHLHSHAMWAIMTVIVVFEFTIGAMLSKGLNRGVGTLLAGLLAIVVGELAERSGSRIGHPIFVGSIALVIGGVVTFAKLWPSLKSYKVGFRTFLLTFSLIMVAEYRGGRPAWHRHQSILDHSLGRHHRLCVNEYLQGSVLERISSKVFMEKIVEDPFYKRYRPTLMSASKRESLAGFASWEPPHGGFKVVKYLWHLYVKVGAVLRHCVFSIVALHGCLQSGIQAPLKVRKLFQEEIRAVGVECACVLRKLGKQIEDMQKGDPATLLKGVEHAVNRLQESL
ncbi:hypothetical protein L7F22_012070 [Adiantum nelumboides]|nr:hypothetical protein [Adiantum nelumboides]